ncbi:hypothetical protein FORMB_17260 [Formosa sp. Hel1_33_131]|uniref:hypothetical protein n=1 Tax=Formosa sp. Hel1_33_131 TaxID=1336794 RepID=UPI00084E26CB|nr:hypothetical protein [Formosa sp. Hel1_33_131]AOR28765.1 hypothetical protein FORMB_17260 [Formosa sp. Hel1_33_131]
MNFKISEPIPKDLRDAMNDVLEKRDYSIISVKDGMASESTIRDLLAGVTIKSEKSVDTVVELVRHSVSKCDDLISTYEGLKSTIKVYNTKISKVG